MRHVLIMGALVATMPAAMATAQPASQTDQTTVTTTVTPGTPAAGAPTSPAPDAVTSGSGSVTSGSGTADVGASTGGVVRQWATQQEIVESAPPAPQSYPLCSRTVQDSCKNPNPSKELPYYPADKTR